MPSSVIARYEYHVQSAVLRVVFVSGMVYDYKDVPESVYQAMKKSKSKGIFLNQHIKGVYDFSRVE